MPACKSAAAEVKSMGCGGDLFGFFSCFTSKGVTKRRGASWHRPAFLNVCHGLVHGLIHMKKQGLLAWDVFESPISTFFLEKCLGVASCCSVILLVSKSVGWCGRKGAVVGDPDTATQTLSWCLMSVKGKRGLIVYHVVS